MIMYLYFLNVQVFFTNALNLSQLNAFIYIPNHRDPHPQVAGNYSYLFN